jgi:hypothetical protein
MSVENFGVDGPSTATANLVGGTAEIVPGPSDTIGDPVYLDISEGIGTNSIVSPTFSGSTTLSGLFKVTGPQDQSISLASGIDAAGQISNPQPKVEEFHIGDLLNVTFKGAFATGSNAPILSVGMSATISIAPPSLPDIAVTSASWHPKQGGVDYGYQVSNGPLPNGSSVDFYWASSPTEADELGGPVFTSDVRSVQTGTYDANSVPASRLGPAPEGAKYLLAVAHAGPANPQTDSVMSALSLIERLLNRNL